ncbi:LPS export ABC transporter periplasmic protein LptC [Psittacicella hinzii]|uniref:LPS export ABC transporter periplasmic protein LptC n=1 Tax=Psittacicella hinzii TaxID=2028575 RepID=A0A3A1Y2H4_9GAMM|nr:LPS export ABC transporter periplasmic protein LptC [Psittacicella hinzii]RIY31499.1 LPS export ABC transporter periplasmic protein LptC [Psittacicella hinzii]
MFLQKRILFVTILLAIAIGYYSLFWKDEESNSNVVAGDQPQMELTNAVLVAFNPLGKSEYTLLSEYTEKEVDSNTFNFKNVLVYSLDQQNISNSIFMSTSSSTLENKVITFPEHMKIFTLGNPNFLRADILNSTLELDSYILSSQSPIVIFGQSFTTKADGFKFYLKDNRYTLDGNVETEYNF